MQTHVTRRTLSQYAGIVDPERLTELRRLAAPLAGMRILHLSAGPFGSAVAETLAALVPLQRDLGLTAHWQWLREAGEHEVSRRFYRGLAGERVEWGRKDREAWETSLREQAAAVGRDYDLVVVHDPQLLGLPQAAGSHSKQPLWVWHCHLDVHGADPAVWADAEGVLGAYTAALFPTEEMIPLRLPVPHRAVARPALDPLALRSQAVAPSLTRVVLQQLGIDPGRPVIGQFAPIDPRYGPVAALGTYWIARQSVPGLQLILADVSSLQHNRPLPEEERIMQMAGGDPNVHIFTNGAGLGATEISVLQEAVGVALQMAVPRGFSWGLAEAQWKGKPAVAGTCGLLPDQLVWGKAGFLVEGAPDGATAVVRLLGDPGLARSFGEQGKRRLVEHHLISGLLKEYLIVLRRLLAGQLVTSSWPVSATGLLDSVG